MRIAPLLLAICGCALSAGEAEAELELSGDLAAGDIRSPELHGARWADGTWRGGDGPARMRMRVALPANRWVPASVTFTPARTGRLTLRLRTPADGATVLWDDAAATGSTLAAGGFEDWDPARTGPWTGGAGIEHDPWLVRSGTAAARVAPGQELAQELTVESGRAVSISVHAMRPAGEPTRGIGLPAAGPRQAADWTAAGFGPEAARLPAGEPIAGIRFAIAAGGASIALLTPGAAALELPVDAGAGWLYLLHSASGPAVAGGPVGSIEPIVGDGSASAAIPVQGGRDVGGWASPTHLPAAVAAWKQPVNGADGSPRSQATAYVGWHAARFALPAGTRAVRLRASDGTWAVAGAAVSRAPVDLAKPAEHTVAVDADWRPIGMRLSPEAGSALDLSMLLDAPAGRHGPVGVRDGRLAFADGTRARFSGVNLSVLFPDLLAVEDGSLDELAGRFARMGINLLRISHVDGRIRRDADGAPGLEPAQLDRLDRLIAACKRLGIYVTIELEMGCMSTAVIKGRYGVESRQAYQAAVFVDPAVMDDLQAWTRLWLGHVNPHTGLDYAHEPAIAFVGMNNEDSLNVWLGPREVNKLPQALRERFATAFAEHLRGIYRDDAELRLAWAGALTAGDRLEARVEVDLAHEGRRLADTAGFLAGLHQRAHAAMDALVRSLGLQAPLTDANFTHTPVTALVRAGLPLVDTHGYFDHRKYARDANELPCQFSQRSMIRPERWWNREFPLTLAASRQTGRAFTVSEYDACYPNRHRAEVGVVLGGMAALQDWDGMLQFTYGSVPESIWSPGYHAKCFDLATDPIKLAAEIQIRLLFLRGDLHPAPGQVEVVASPADVRDGAFQSTEADLLPYVTRVALRVGEPGPGPAIVLSRQAPASAQALPRAADATPAALAGWFASVKDRILPAGNRSDARAGLMVSATGELTWDFAHEQVLVDSPRSRGAVVKSAGDVALTGLGLRLDAGAASCTVHGLDGEPLERSRRILAILATDAQNLGQHTEQDGRMVYAWGGGQRVLRTGTARIALAHDGPLEAWALDTGGARVARIPTEFRDGVVVVLLDQRQHPCVFWELAAP